MLEQYIRGGEGDDIIRSGGDVFTSIIYGGSGDDIIYPATNEDDTRNQAEVDTIFAGDGDDVINPTTYFQPDGTVDTSSENRGSEHNKNVKWDGGEGDDIIWGAWGS